MQEHRVELLFHSAHVRGCLQPDFNCMQPLSMVLNAEPAQLYRGYEGSVTVACPGTKTTLH